MIIHSHTRANKVKPVVKENIQEKPKIKKKKNKKLFITGDIASPLEIQNNDNIIIQEEEKEEEI